MPPRGRLPRRRSYADLPVWPDNIDDVETRTVNAAWNALFDADLDDLSFRTLAREVGVTHQALYHYYPNMGALAAAVAVRACLTLHGQLTEPQRLDHPRPKSLKAVVNAYLSFAEKRPRHFALMFSPRFSDHDAFPIAVGERLRLGRALIDLLTRELGAEPDLGDVHVFWGILHGAATLVASGHISQPQRVLAACERHLEDLRRQT